MSYVISEHNKTKNSVVTLTKEVLFILFLIAVVLIIRPLKASAATFNVVAGDYAINSGDSNCQLEEAVKNINDGARTYADCVETGAYGTDDTINLPNGTINDVSGSGFIEITKSAKIIGQGRDQSVLNDLPILMSSAPSDDFMAKDFKMTGSNGMLQFYQANNVTADNLEFESFELFGIGAQDINNLQIRNSYFFNQSAGSTMASIIIGEFGSGTTNATIENVTINNGKSDGIYLIGSGLALNAIIKNTTITNLTGDSDVAGIRAEVEDSNNHINYTTINNTISNITTTGGSTASAIYEYSGSMDNTSSINHTAQNDIYAVGDGTAGKVNYYMDQGSTAVHSTTSNGGNLSSDNTMAGFLTQSSDKHNQTSLASFLGVLGDNGGSVPTLALLPGSPAIDGGTTAGSVTTDARGTSRPQGSAYDSGAYELVVENNGGGEESGSNTVNVTGSNGSNTSLGGTPTIAKLPTFSGVTTPFATVEVTVHSDPVVCTATADALGNWSCTLPNELAPGTHTVNVRITMPDSSVVELGPYNVVVEAGQPATVTNNSKLANTGFDTLKAIVGIGILLITTTTAILYKRFKTRVKTVYSGR